MSYGISDIGPAQYEAQSKGRSDEMLRALMNLVLQKKQMQREEDWKERTFSNQLSEQEFNRGIENRRTKAYEDMASRDRESDYEKRRRNILPYGPEAVKEFDLYGTSLPREDTVLTGNFKGWVAKKHGIGDKEWGSLPAWQKRDMFTTYNNEMQTLDSRVPPKDTSYTRTASWLADQLKNVRSERNRLLALSKSNMDMIRKKPELDKYDTSERDMGPMTEEAATAQRKAANLQKVEGYLQRFMPHYARQQVTPEMEAHLMDILADPDRMAEEGQYWDPNNPAQGFMQRTMRGASSVGSEGGPLTPPKIPEDVLNRAMATAKKKYGDRVDRSMIEQALISSYMKTGKYEF